MGPKLEALLENARNIKMTEAKLRDQRRSFVYGNLRIDNDIITREMIAEADEKIEREETSSL